jgi:hypothetical protein
MARILDTNHPECHNWRAGSQERRHLCLRFTGILAGVLTDIEFNQTARSQEGSDQQQTKRYPETNRPQAKGFRHRDIPEPLKDRCEQQRSEDQNCRDEEDEKHELHLHGKFLQIARTLSAARRLAK